MDKAEAIRQIGRVVAEYRSRHGHTLTQEKLAEALSMTRTDIAHFEEGRAILGPEKLASVCRHLNIPERQWLIGTHPFYFGAMQFKGILSEFIGREARHDQLEGVDQLHAAERIHVLFSAHLSESQSHSQFNSIMVIYGERPVTSEFFFHYFGVDSFRDRTFRLSCG